MCDSSGLHKTSCRLCLDTDENFMSVFDVPELDRLIYQCVCIKILPSDSLPTNICFKCISEVQNWTRFKKSCDQIQKVLLKSTKKSPIQSSNLNSVMNDSTNDINLSIFEHESLFNDLENETMCSVNMSLLSSRQPAHSTPLPEAEQPPENKFSVSCKVQIKEEAKNDLDYKIPYNEEAPIKRKHLFVKNIERCYQAVKQRSGENRFPDTFRSYNCEKCSKSYSKFKELVYHDQLKHKDLLETQAVHCDRCSHVFLNADRLEMHIQMQHADRAHQCPICMRNYVSRSSLRVHMYQHSDKNKCRVCSKKFNSKTTLAEHMDREHLKVKRHACNFCDKTFCSASDVSRHRRHVHLSLARYQCDQCDVTAKTRQSLCNHILSVHTREKNFFCELCGDCHKTHCALLQHKKKMHNPLVQLFSCPICSQVFRSHQGYRIHVKRHREPGKVNMKLCHHCDRPFRLKMNLAKHIKQMHMGTAGNTQVCSCCGKSFLRRHTCQMMSEKLGEDTGEEKLMTETRTRYLCKQCSRHYSNKFNLKRHFVSAHASSSVHNILDPVNKLDDVVKEKDDEAKVKQNVETNLKKYVELETDSMEVEVYDYGETKENEK